MTTVQERPCEGAKAEKTSTPRQTSTVGAWLAEQSKERVKRLRWFVIAYQAGVDPLDSLEAKKFEDILLQFFFWRDGSE